MRLKKLLLFFIVQLSFNVAYAKDFSVEDVKNAEKYVLYESVYHGVSYLLHKATI